MKIGDRVKGKEGVPIIGGGDASVEWHKLHPDGINCIPKG
mgnify:CR=1 FL=1